MFLHMRVKTEHTVAAVFTNYYGKQEVFFYQTRDYNYPLVWKPITEETTIWDMLRLYYKNAYIWTLDVLV